MSDPRHDRSGNTLILFVPYDFKILPFGKHFADLRYRVILTGVIDNDKFEFVLTSRLRFEFGQTICKMRHRFLLVLGRYNDSNAALKRVVCGIVVEQF